MKNLLPAALIVVSLACVRLSAQAIATSEASAPGPATTSEAGPAGIVPFVSGPNLSLGTTSQHDSSNGWSSLLTPNAAWRFNRFLSVDAGAPIYVYINIDTNTGTKARPVYTYKPRHFIAGDTSLNGHFEVNPRLLAYNLTASLGLPSGDTAAGLGAGQVTYSVNNHFEKSLGIFSPDIELGIGDSSSLVRQRVRKSYTAVGKNAHFQAGLSIDLPHNLSFSANAYEELPLSSETIYSTTGRGKKKVTTATSKSVGEDNGFLTSLDIPLSGHVTLSGFYNRSLRSRIDTAGFSLTFLLKAPPHDVPR